MCFASCSCVQDNLQSETQQCLLDCPSFPSTEDWLSIALDKLYGCAVSVKWVFKTRAACARVYSGALLLTVVKEGAGRGCCMVSSPLHHPHPCSTTPCFALMWEPNAGSGVCLYRHAFVCGDCHTRQCDKYCKCRQSISLCCCWPHHFTFCP